MKPRKPLERHTPLARAPMKRRKRSAAKQSAKFLREYGGEARHAWVESLPCIVPGCPRPSRNAHVVNIDAGMSRKGHHRGIAPLCDCHHTESEHALHEIGPRSFEALHGLSLKACSDRTAAQWDAHQERVA